MTYTATSFFTKELQMSWFTGIVNRFTSTTKPFDDTNATSQTSSTFSNESAVDKIKDLKDKFPNYYLTNAAFTSYVLCVNGYDVTKDKTKQTSKQSSLFCRTLTDNKWNQYLATCSSHDGGWYRTMTSDTYTLEAHLRREPIGYTINKAKATAVAIDYKKINSQTKQST